MGFRVRVLASRRGGFLKECLELGNTYLEMQQKEEEEEEENTELKVKVDGIPG